MSDPQLTRLTSALADRYRIERELGAGGMATVYLAADLKHDRQVAVKVLRPELSASLGAERFLSEIRTTAKLAHPHILPLHDSGQAEGFLFYVMPFVEGESLRQRLTREGTLPVDEAVRIAREIADALAYAHSHGVIHRDVKPENILLQASHAIVADFGIARAVSAAGSERLTLVGMALGTPSYMSPEQAAGEADVDGRSDLYALASLLYDMLAGEPPFTGPTMESILVQRFTRPAPRITVKRPNVPRGIEAAISTALAREPADRFASVERFAEALDPKSGAGSGESRDRSIAVLPFANMSGEAEAEYFSDGISEEIINALAQLPGLRVAARTSAFSFKGKNTDLRSVGDQLNVSTVLEGSVRKAGNRLRITAQLINVADGYHLWSERFDREHTDIFAIQDEIATAIAAKLEVTLGVRDSGPLVKPPTDNLEAYDLYLKGHALALQRGPSIPRAVECLERAVSLDPEFALAQAELAEALLFASLYGMKRLVDLRERAQEAANRSMMKDPNLPAAHVAQALLAFFVEYDREKATRAWARARELDPFNPETRGMRALYDLCYVHGGFDEGVNEMRAALELDPLNVFGRSQLALLLAWGGRFEEAAAEARQALKLDAEPFYPHWTLLHALILGPKPEEGIAQGVAMLARFGRHPWVMMALALANGRSGRQDAADALYAELAARARTEYVQPGVRGFAALGAGRREDCFRHMREALEVKDPLFTLVALHWPGLGNLAGDPEYLTILKSMGWERPVQGGTPS